MAGASAGEGTFGSNRPLEDWKSLLKMSSLLNYPACWPRMHPQTNGHLLMNLVSGQQIQQNIVHDTELEGPSSRLLWFYQLSDQSRKQGVFRPSKALLQGWLGIWGVGVSFLAWSGSIPSGPIPSLEGLLGGSKCAFRPPCLPLVLSHQCLCPPTLQSRHYSDNKGSSQLAPALSSLSKPGESMWLTPFLHVVFNFPHTHPDPGDSQEMTGLVWRHCSSSPVGLP
ncbi:hypothetical protein P7K49_019789 [Saguinus oedipus]|uniref:Uncharacterized protein n=1 Tax=Saguinus oedipus TaxID=9490 RepID=A0ABQ9UYF0_SAGOE|nr:hypothetical protein P7K49_019789 [Saguinus oedipus]